MFLFGLRPIEGRIKNTTDKKIKQSSTYVVTFDNIYTYDNESWYCLVQSYASECRNTWSNFNHCSFRFKQMTLIFWNAVASVPIRTISNIKAFYQDHCASFKCDHYHVLCSWLLLDMDANISEDNIPFNR